MATTHSTPITPKDDPVLKQRLFAHKFLPEMAGMSLSEFEALEEEYSTLASSFRLEFFNLMYKKIYIDHIADVLVKFAEEMPAFATGETLESSDGYIFYPVEELTFQQAFINGVLCKLNQVSCQQLYLHVAEDEHDTVVVSSGPARSNAILTFKVQGAWEALKNFAFNPDAVQIKAHRYIWIK